MYRRWHLWKSDKLLTFHNSFNKLEDNCLYIHFSIFISSGLTKTDHCLSIYTGGKIQIDLLLRMVISFHSTKAESKFIQSE